MNFLVSFFKEKWGYQKFGFNEWFSQKNKVQNELKTFLREESYFYASTFSRDF